MGAHKNIPNFCYGNDAIRISLGYGPRGGVVARPKDLAIYTQNRRSQDVLSRIIQPTSLDTVVGSRWWQLDVNFAEELEPNIDKRVEEMLDKSSIVDKGEFNSQTVFYKDHAYLVELEESFSASRNREIRADNKSNSGRSGVSTRWFADFQNAKNSAIGRGKDVVMKTYLLVEPRAFNVHIESGLSLNQIRLFGSKGAIVPKEELYDMHIKTPIAYRFDENGELQPSAIIRTKGLDLTLDALGLQTEGVVGYRARSTTEVLDMTIDRKVSPRKAQDPWKFWIPVLSQNGAIEVEPNTLYLALTNEWLDLRNNLEMGDQEYSLCAMMEYVSQSLLRGESHDAGFFDKGFIGRIVAEIFSFENRKKWLPHNALLSSAEYILVENCSSSYDGKNHYNGQDQINFPKHMQQASLERAALYAHQLERRASRRAQRY